MPTPGAGLEIGGGVEVADAEAMQIRNNLPGGTEAEV